MTHAKPEHLWRPRVVPDPPRVRSIRGSFGWIDHRLLRDGHLTRMGLDEIGLYVFLVLAADRHGVSWYRKEHICKAVGLREDQFHLARDRLLEKQLIAFLPFRLGDVNGYCQVLAVPMAKPLGDPPAGRGGSQQLGGVLTKMLTEVRRG